MTLNQQLWNYNNTALPTLVKYVTLNQFNIIELIIITKPSETITQATVIFNKQTTLLRLPEGGRYNDIKIKRS